MAGNTFGKLFKLATFGESHGPAIGGVIDGCPAGLKLDLEAIQNELNRRKPGQSEIVTQRKEPDTANQEDEHPVPPDPGEHITSATTTPRVTTASRIDFNLLRPLFGWLPVDTIKHIRKDDSVCPHAQL